MPRRSAMSATTSRWRNCGPARPPMRRARCARSAPSSTGAAAAARRIVFVQAAAAYRLGAGDEALAAAQEVLARSPLDRETASRAWYIRGAVLADRGDAQGLAQALAALPAVSNPTRRATASAQRPRRTARRRDQPRGAGTRAGGRSAPAGTRLSRHGARAGAGRRSGTAPRPLRRCRRPLFAGGPQRTPAGRRATGRLLLDRADQLARESGASDVRAEVERVKKAAELDAEALNINPPPRSAGQSHKNSLSRQSAF